MIKTLFRRAKPALQLGAMKYTNLGRSGLKVSRICLGAMSFGSPEWQAWTIPEDQAGSWSNERWS